MAKYPDTSASTYYRLDEALFTGDPNGYLSTGFADTGRGISWTLAAGGSAFTDLWDSAHIVWRAKRQIDGSPVPLYSASGVPDWSRAYVESLGLAPFSDTESVRIQLIFIGAPSGATSISDFSSASPNIIGGGLSFASASGPTQVNSTSAGGGTIGGTRYTTTEGCKVEVTTAAAPNSGSLALATNAITVWGVDALGMRGGNGAFRTASSTIGLLGSTNDTLYLMLSILKLGSATGGSAEYTVRSRLDLRSPNQ